MFFSKIPAGDAKEGAMIQKPPQAHSHVGARPNNEWSKDNGHPRP